MQTKIQRKKKAFTLVELVIVITILAILATLAFVSFQGYSSKSRDSNRVTTVKNIENGVEIFLTKSGKIPEVEQVFASGALSGTTLNIVGFVWNTIIRQINLNELPKDPKNGKQYEYWVDISRRYYQVGMTFEAETASLPWISQTFANQDYKTAGVLGNYVYPLSYSGKLYSLPSLLFTGDQTFSDTGTCFVVNEWGNTFENTSTGCVETVSKVLQKVAGTGGVSLTWISVPEMSSSDFKNADGIPSAFSWLTLALWITDKTKLWTAIYGTKYVEDSNIWSNKSWNKIESSWKTIDPNCPYGDVVIWTQTWAGCNSTLWNGWGDSSSTEWVFHTIYWKLYTAGDNARSACGTWRHVPSDEEWTTLENYMWKKRGNTSNCRISGWRECPWLGYKNYSTQTSDTNIVIALKIPLSWHTGWYRKDTCAFLLTDSNSSLYMRYFANDIETVYRYAYAPSYGYSVRCIKN